MQHVQTDGDTVLREKDHAHPVSPRDTDLAHFISSVKFNASSDSPAGVVRMAQLGATDDVVIPSKENLKQLLLSTNCELRKQALQKMRGIQGLSTLLTFALSKRG